MNLMSLYTKFWHLYHSRFCLWHDAIEFNGWQWKEMLRMRSCFGIAPFQWDEAQKIKKKKNRYTTASSPQ